MLHRDGNDPPSSAAEDIIATASSINTDSATVDVPRIDTASSRAVRNILILCFSYFLFFTGFWSLSNLQSTMNAEQGMGPESQAVIYLFSMISCFLPQIMITKLSAKKTYILSLLASCPYIAANLHLRWDVMMTSSVLFGLFNGPLNTALATYLDEMALRYQIAIRGSPENVIALFFGIFMFFSESTQVLGNGVAYIILDGGVQKTNATLKYNCGVDFHAGSVNDTNRNLDPPSEHSRIILTGVYLSLCVLAMLCALALDPLKTDVTDVSGCDSISQTVFAAVRLLKNPHQCLLIPLSMFIGIESTFYANEFTEAFIACSWGIHHVGFVTICFGVCGAVMAFLVGPLVKCISQMSVIILAALINVTTCALLFVWQPSPDTPIFYFVFAGSMGITDAIWWSQIPALYGLIFPNDREAAFSNFFFWSFFGYFISYSYANYLTVAIKINIMLLFLTVGIILFVIGQIKIRRSSQRDYVALVEAD